jgi:hypothetical protein
MWQTGITLLIVAGVLVYLIRCITRAYRSESSTCSSCSAGCAGRGNNGVTTGTLDCTGPAPPFNEQTSEGGRSDLQ